MKRKSKLSFLFIGAPKCGSTWIYECLQEHPEIKLVSNKNQPSNDFLFEKDRKEIKKDLASLQNNGKIIGELNEFYLYASREVIKNAHQHNPEMKIIVSLRDPVQRAYSGYLCINSLRNKGWKSFAEGLKKNPQYIDGGLYYKELQKFYDLFDEENILPLIFEKAKENREDFIKRIYDFIDVNSSYRPKSLEVETGSTKFKLTKAGRLLHRTIIHPFKNTKIFWGLKSSPFVRRFFYRLGSSYSALSRPQKPKMKPKTKNMLSKKYKDDINQLENLIGEDLSCWKNNAK